MLDKTTILQALLLVTMMTPALCISLRGFAESETTPSHKYWFSKDSPLLKGDDSNWYYCDYKCISLQKLNPNKDFVVIVFSAPLKQKFSACYVKAGTTYTLWSKVTSNQFFEKHCGEDYKDWMIEGSFKIDGEYGVGIGTLINEQDQAKMYPK